MQFTGAGDVPVIDPRWKHVLPRTVTGRSRFAGRPLFGNLIRDHNGPRMVCRRAAGCLFESRVEGGARFGAMLRCGRGEGGFVRGFKELSGAAVGSRSF